MSTDPLEEKARARILVVDDEASSLDTLCNLLRPHHQVLAALTGLKALEIAATAPQPDLILLDMLMSGMDGDDVFVRLGDNPATRGIPVIFVTGMNSAEDEERGFALGAVDYITKPYRPLVVQARVRTQLELKRARDWLRDQNVHLEAEVVRRVKESQQAEIQLLQSEKLAAIGQLTAGMAHEINNPIGYVTSNLVSLYLYLQDIFELLDAYEAAEGIFTSDPAALANIRELKQQKRIGFLRDDIGKLLAESRQGLDRVEQIVRDLLNFARAEGNDWQWADLTKGLDSTLNIVWNEIKSRCTLHKDYGAIPEVYCIPSQINQVLLNLLVNAAQAISGNGDITIRTGHAEGEAFIAITDTGCGIAAENLPRLFEPFFTTKPVGKGTGLGLSIAYGIVKKHGGRIEVESEVGTGTTITVWLPTKPPGEVAVKT